MNITSFHPGQQTSVNAHCLNDQVAKLQVSYSLLSDVDLITDAIAEVPALYTLLKEAVKPLQQAFGKKNLLQIEALRSDEDTVLRVMVKLADDYPKPAEIMRKFKREWWLTNAHRSQGFLVFDYEIGNGF